MKGHSEASSGLFKHTWIHRNSLLGLKSKASEPTEGPVCIMAGLIMTISIFISVVILLSSQTSVPSIYYRPVISSDSLARIERFQTRCTVIVQNFGDDINNTNMGYCSILHLNITLYKIFLIRFYYKLNLYLKKTRYECRLIHSPIHFENKRDYINNNYN